VFVSDEELEVTAPDVSWSDMASGAELFGAELPDPTTLPDRIPLATRLHVRNPAGCEGELSDAPMLLIPNPDGFPMETGQ
jgi:hypothetical protein